MILCDNCSPRLSCSVYRNGDTRTECEFYQPMTEQEYLQSCNTEQLAEWLGDKLDYCQIMWYWACDKCTWSKKHESCMNDKEKWMEWLKQPHKEE